jgi:hypothetical protein
MDECDTKRFLKPADRLADGGAGNAHCVGRGAKALFFRNESEGCECVEV